MNTFDTVYEPPLEWVTQRLAALSARPPRRAVVAVPSERHAHALRRHLCLSVRRPDLLAGVRLLRPVALAQELLVHAGDVRRIGWEEVRPLRILRLFESASLAGVLRYFDAEQLRGGQGYVDAFARTIAELEGAGVDAALARRVAQDLARHDPAAGDRLHDVAMVWTAADAEGFGSAAQVLMAAADAVAARPQLGASLGPVLAVLTASPSSALLRFLAALPACRAVLQEALPVRAETQRWRRLVALTPTTPERSTHPANGEITIVHRFLFQPPEILTDPLRPRSAGPDGTVDVEEYASIEEEVEAAAVWAGEQISAGVPLEQIALIVPETDPYAPALVDRLQRLSGDGKIAVHVAGGLPLAASPAGRRLDAVITALSRWLEAEATIRVLPALRRNGQPEDGSPLRLSPSRAAKLVYEAGIVGGSPGDPRGAREWGARMSRRRDALRELLADTEAADGAADDPEKRAHLLDRQQAQRWLNDVEPILPAVTALQALAEAILAGASLNALWPQLRAFADRWLRLPPDPPQLLARLDAALQPLASDPVAAEVRGGAALRMLRAALARQRQETARFGDPSLFIGTPAHAAGLPFTAVRVLGVAEGALPHTPHDDPIVPDGLRQHVEAAARALRPDVVLPRLADRVLDEIHDVYRVVTATSARLALSAPRQWVDRSDREVSGILLEVATALARRTAAAPHDGDVPTVARLRAAYLHVGCAARRDYAARHPLGPRAVAAAVRARESPPLVPAAWLGAGVLALDRIADVYGAARGDTLGAVDGVVTGAWELERPPGLLPLRPVSASGLTRLLECPHRFLLERILHLNEPASAPAVDAIDPLAYGSLFHAAVERFLRAHGAAVCRREGTVEDWIARAQDIARAAFDELCAEYPLRAADALERERARLLRQIEQLVRYEWNLPPRDFLASELRFGFDAPLALAAGAVTLHLRGAIDRVDRLAPDALSVRDLKTGRIHDLREEPLNAKRDLQIGLYVLALEALGLMRDARATQAAYVHPSAAQELERGFAGGELERLRRHTRAWLAIAAQLLRAGSFPRTPDPADCLYCPFAPACGEGAQQRSAAKLDRLAPDDPLAAFVRLKRAQHGNDG